MLTSPVADISALAWAHHIVDDLPKPLQIAFPPSGPGAGTSPEIHHPVVRGTAATPGATTALRYPGAGRWRHKQAAGSTVHWVWGGAADILLHGALPTRLTLGNPLIALRFVDPVDAADEDGDPAGVSAGDALELDGAPVDTDDLTIVACAPGAPGLDTLSVLRYLADALTAQGISTGSPSWQDLVVAMSGLNAPLRILEPGGSPATGRTVALAGGGSATLAAGDHGDALTALGISRSDLAAGASLDVAGGAQVVASADGTPHPDGLVPVTASTSLVTVASIHDWLAEQGSPALERFTRGNTVVPFVDGVATFADLFHELNRAVDAGPLGAFYVTGYSLQHDAELGPEGAATPRRTVAEVAEDLAAAGGDARFLALQMLQPLPGVIPDAQQALAFTAMALALVGAGATAFQTDSAASQATFFVHAQAIAVALFLAAGDLQGLLDKFELNKESIEALDDLAGVEAHLDPVDADVDDNPLASAGGALLPAALELQRKWNVFHQKIQVVRNADGIHAYCGGIDLNKNRTQTPVHAGRSPFHDVHARVDGPAAGELATTFVERWRVRSSTTLDLDTATAFDSLPTDGDGVVQIGRTYYRPEAGSGRGLVPYAEDGERTILDTLLAAIGRARRYLYIEDQYLTPPREFRDALIDAAARVSGPLIIVVPSTPDQPFGLPRRQGFIADLRMAWGGRLRVGILRKRFSHTSTTRQSASGRLWLAEQLDSASGIIEVSPPNRVPSTPFWLTVDGEAMRAYQPDAVSSPTSARLHVERGDDSRLFGATKGTSRKTHKRHAAVLAGHFPGVYVHTKMVLVDDAFAAIGSANCNRRGYYSDGECTLFSLRENVVDGDNWIRDLRIALWAEHLGVPVTYAQAALRDPAASLALFDRRFTVGNRFTTFEAQPYATDFSLATEFTESTSTMGGLRLIATFAASLGVALVGSESDAIFDTVIDPSSRVDGFPVTP
jgi:phosphatidylserine/phosphatidylglycerophosphate/cardiolipin synthase-like enzyme